MFAVERERERELFIETRKISRERFDQVLKIGIFWSNGNKDDNTM